MTHKVTKPIALDESFRTTEQNPQNIADVLANKLDAIKSAIENGGSDEMEAAFECHYNVTSATDIYNAMQEKKVPFFYQNGVVAQLWKVETNKYTFRTTITRVVEGENILDIVDYIVNGSVWSTATKTISGGSSSQQAYLAKVESSVNFDTTGLSGMQSIISVNDVPADGVYQLSIFMCITPKTASATKSDLVFQFTGTSGTGMPNTTFHAVVDDSQTFAQQLSFSTTLNLKAGTNTLKMACGDLNTEYLVFVDDLTVAQLVNGVYHNGDDFEDVHTLPEIPDFNNDDGVLVDGATGGPRFMLWQTLANKVLGFIKSLSTTITAFRTGDVIPVDGPSGTAKMSKDDLLKETAENSNNVNGYKVEALKNAINATSTTCTSDASGHKCFVYPMLAGCRYRITAGTANIGTIYLCRKLSTSSADRIEKLSDGIYADTSVIVTPSNSAGFVSFYYLSASSVIVEALSVASDITDKGDVAYKGTLTKLTSDAQGWKVFYLHLYSGKKFRFTCNGVNAVTTVCSLDNASNTSEPHRIETFHTGALLSGESFEFEVTQEAYYFAVYYAGASEISLLELDTILDCEKRIEETDAILEKVKYAQLSYKGTIEPTTTGTHFAIDGVSFTKGRTYTIGLQVSDQVTNDGYITVKISTGSDQSAYVQLGAFMNADFPTLDEGIFYSFTWKATEDLNDMRVGSYFNGTTFNDAKMTYFINDITDIVESVSTVGENATNAETFYPSYYSNELAQLKAGSDKVFVLVSDLHKAATNFQRVCDVAKAIGADAILNGGDFVNSVGTESLTWFNDIVNAQTIPVLSILGNHEGWSSTSPWIWQTAEDNYNLIMPTIVTQAGVVQPVDASTLFKCYYYKDFGNIRIICIDGIDYNMTNAHHWDAAQLSWFQSVLADAITNSKKVVVFNHYPYDKTKVTQKDEGWNSWETYLNNYRLFDDMYTPASAVAAVKDFIDAGGVFVGWLTGHMHRDLSVTINDDARQYMMTTASGSYAKHTDSASFSDISQRQYDCFTLIGVDTTHGFIKFLRCGLDEDSTLAKRKPYTWDYVNRRFFKSN